MLKKTVLTFAFLTILTTFYGLNARFSSPVIGEFDATVIDNSLISDDEYVISAYDNIIRNISEQEGNDWRLMSAIAYHESRFRPEVISGVGARGIMQIMPATARQFDVPADSLSDPKINILLANKVLNRLERALRLPQGTSERDRMSLMLASYNGGIGHVNDARRLARLDGQDANSWEVVARYLQLKADPEYYEHEVVRCGRFTGSRQTLAYVRNVIDHYKKYCSMTVR